MKNYYNSDYAINKNAKGIVYRLASQTVEVTLEDYLRENPNKTDADFIALKALSDEDYYETDRSDYRQTWKNISFDTLGKDESIIFSAPSVENDITERWEQEAMHAKRQSLAARALDKLTGVQRRRYLMYHVQGKSYREIANEEKAHFTSVKESVLAAEKKIKKFLSQQG